MTAPPPRPSRRWNTDGTHPAAVRRSLLRWFRRHARPLPWRSAPSPYATWVSEVMLQQTQVSTVIPYYLRFMEAFPSVQRLAAAPLERVLELWSGLGYYRRARMLHQAAQAMVERFNSEFPPDYDSARSLPGVGDYTARAVLSIAYQQPYFVLDGNVARVAARLLAFAGNIHQQGFRQAVDAAFERLFSRKRPGDFNQAIMQLGQVVCTPSAPQCGLCPLRRCCKALAYGAIGRYPAARPRRAATWHHLAAAVVRCGKKVALVRGLDDGLLSDLWNFPSCFGRTGKAARRSLELKLDALLPGIQLESSPAAKTTHNITHRAIRVEVYGVSVGNERVKARKRRQGSAPGHSEVRWMSSAQLSKAAISALARKIAARAVVSRPR